MLGTDYSAGYIYRYAMPRGKRSSTRIIQGGTVPDTRPGSGFWYPYGISALLMSVGDGGVLLGRNAQHITSHTHNTSQEKLFDEQTVLL